MRRGGTIGLVMLAAVASPWIGGGIGERAAAAQPAQAAPIAPADAVAERAEALFREGNALVKQQKWADAEASFLAVWALRPTYDVAANLGHTQHRLGKLREAAEHLEIAVRQWPLSGKREPRELAAAKLAELRKSLVSVKLTVSVAGAEVLVDGRRIGVSPIDHEVFLDPGKRTIVARKEGYRDAKIEVETGAGASAELPLTMQAEVETAAPGAAEPTGGGVEPRPSPEMHIEESGGMPPRRTVLIAGGATAGAALVAGVIFTVVANGKAGDAEEQREALVKMGGPASCAGATSACEELESSLHGKDAFSNAALWSFVGAGVLGAATAVYAVVTSKRSDAPSTGAMPVVTAHGGGIAWRGAW